MFFLNTRPVKHSRLELGGRYNAQSKVFAVHIESGLGGCIAADNFFSGIVEVGCKKCQKVTVCGPELSFKMGIKWCDGQKIGWELKRL